MAKATIYTITVTKAHESSDQGTFFSLDPWGANSLYYEGYDDGGKDFQLPDGIAVGRNRDGVRILYERTSGRAVEICAMDGGPVLRYSDLRYPLETMSG